MPARRQARHAEEQRKTRPSTSRERPMDDASSEIADLDDFQVIAERRQAAETIAALTDRYRKLSQEMNRRENLRWMLP
jgi:hypothetical protein